MGRLRANRTKLVLFVQREMFGSLDKTAGTVQFWWELVPARRDSGGIRCILVGFRRREGGRGEGFLPIPTGFSGDRSFVRHHLDFCSFFFGEMAYNFEEIVAFPTEPGLVPLGHNGVIWLLAVREWLGNGTFPIGI